MPRDDLDLGPLVYNLLGIVAQRLGDSRAAIDAYRVAVDRFRLSGNQEAEGQALANLSFAFLGLDFQRQAEEALARAAQLELRAPSRRADRALRSGDLARARGDYSSAIEQYEEGLRIQGISELARAALENARGMSLVGLGSRDSYQRAAEAYASARRLYAQLDLERAGSYVEINRARLSELRGRPGAALAQYHSALEHFLITGDAAGQASTYHGMALAARRAGDTAATSRFFEMAITRVESMRSQVEDAALRAGHLSRRSVYYDTYVDVLLDRVAAGGGAGLLERAVEVDDLRRARGLVDGLGAPAGSPPRWVRSQARVDELTMVRERLVAARKRGDEDRIQGLELRLAALEAEVEETAAQDAPPSRPRLFGRIQSSLDAETVLLVWSLRPQASTLFWISHSDLEAFDLGSRTPIEAQARIIHGLLSVPGRERELAPQLKSLADKILGPIAPRLVGQRLLVIADSALLDIPFSVLPKPGIDAWRPLLVDHEIVYLPSASTHLLLRQTGPGSVASRPRTEVSIAIVADPVFAADDDRISTDRRLPPRPAETPVWPRLRASAAEACRIAARFDPDERLLALGLDANARWLRSEALSEYDIIHLATHGDLDPPPPALPRLVFSRFDRAGERDPRYLVTAAEIYQLSLPAELVVLSACLSSAARDSDAGLTSLAHAFFHAGARRLVGSLWRVRDESTARLMDFFYQGLIDHGLRPSAALAFAQRTLRSEGSSASDWAAFVFEGDWRGFD